MDSAAQKNSHPADFLRMAENPESAQSHSAAVPSTVL